MTRILKSDKQEKKRKTRKIDNLWHFKYVVICLSGKQVQKKKSS